MVILAGIGIVSLTIFLTYFGIKLYDFVEKTNATNNIIEKYFYVCLKQPRQELSNDLYIGHSLTHLQEEIKRLKNKKGKK